MSLKLLMSAVDTLNERNVHGSENCSLEIAISSCVDITDKAEARRKAAIFPQKSFKDWESSSVLFQRLAKEPSYEPTT